MKCLVFGGTQFVGLAVVHRLVKEGHDVTIVNRGNNTTPKGCKQLIADRNNKEELESVLIGKEYDVVYDISAYTPHQTKIAVNLLEGRVGHYIHISSAAVYLDNNEYPFSESSPTGHNTNWGDYGYHKHLCEKVLRKRFTETAFPITIFRPFYIYGPGNNLDRETFVFKRLFNHLPIIIPGKGRPIIQFGHIDDLVDALHAVTNQPKSFGEVYNIGDQNCVSFERWVHLCAEAIGKKATSVIIEANEYGLKARDWFPFRDIHLFGNVTKLYDHFQIKQKYSLREGLEQTVTNLQASQLISFNGLSTIEKDLLERLKYK